MQRRIQNLSKHLRGPSWMFDCVLNTPLEWNTGLK